MVHSRISQPVQATFTRPADTTAYTIGDVIGPAVAAVQSFGPCVRSPGFGGRVTGVTLTKSDKSVTLTTFDLYLFHTAPAAIADNAEFLPTDAEILNLIGIIPMAAASFVQSGGAANALNAVYHSSAVAQRPDILFQCASGSQTIYGVLVARGAYVPVSGEVISILLHIEHD